MLTGVVVPLHHAGEVAISSEHERRCTRVVAGSHQALPFFDTRLEIDHVDVDPSAAPGFGVLHPRYVLPSESQPHNDVPARASFVGPLEKDTPAHVPKTAVRSAALIIRDEGHRCLSEGQEEDIARHLALAERSRPAWCC